MQKKRNTKLIFSTGFTLIELLITTALSVVLLLAISSLFMTFLLSNAKTNTKKTIKAEGIHALSQMEFLLRNAHYIDETTNTCSPNMSSIDIVSLDGGKTSLKTSKDTSNKDRIASNSAFLTSDAVTINNPLTFDCSGNKGNRQIKINFTLQKITPDGTSSENFSSIVNIRN